MITPLFKRHRRSICAMTLCLFFFHSTTFAATPPDAGKTLQELRSQQLSPQSTSKDVLQSPEERGVEPGGPQVTLQSIRLSGNTVFSDETLLRLLEDAAGKSFDLAGLNGLAGRISDYYHEKDYPFARAMIPAQAVKSGVLEITVVEGRYGDIKIEGEDRRAERAQSFLAGLRSGDVIRGNALERITLLLNDQPGYTFIPVMRPGEEPGTGDLSVKTQRDSLFSGGLRFDDHGNRYTGRLRWLGDLSANSLLFFGDQIALNLIYGEWNTWLGSAAYSLPLGSSGLRGNISYNYSYYQLGKEFDSLDAHGTAQDLGSGLSYALVRSQRANLGWAMSYHHKWLKDEQDSTGVSDEKSSDSLPVVLNFDLRDFLFGGGITYGALGWTLGFLHLNSGLTLTDSTSAKSQGIFNKMNLDIARLQTLPGKFSFYGRASGQLAFNNLDSSEDFGLGGPNGVRAYPVGEGYGDEGVLTQAELRYGIGPFSPYGFYDFGYTKTNQEPWAAGDNNRAVGGAGFGLRFDYGSWSANCSFAWRTSGGRPESDSRRQMPAIWFNIGYQF